MSNVLRLAIVDPDDSSRDALKSKFLGMDIVWLEAECSRYEFFGDVVEQTKPDVGVIALDSDPEKGLELVEKLSASASECSVLVISGSTDGQLILQAIRAGAKEFLAHPVKIEDLVGALDRISQQRFGQTDGGKPRGCTTIAVCGATGGVGSTSVAVNLACSLASNPNNSVVLADLDLTLGDADVFLDTIPDYTLLDVAQNVSRLDFTLLKRSLTKHSSGLYLLPRPVQLQDVALITPSDMVRVVGLLKASFSHLVFDCSKSFSDVDVQALRAADYVLMVIQLDLPCLRNVVRLMMAFDEDERLKETTKIIVNRSGLDSGQISLKKAQETIGRDVFCHLPNDYRTMSEVRNNGVPLIEQAPRAAITQAFRSLAEQIGGSEMSPEEDEAKKGRGWLGRLTGRKA